jgi:hypothetical protein
LLTVGGDWVGVESNCTTTRKPALYKSFNTGTLTFEFGLLAGCVAEEPKEVYFSEFMHSDEPSSLTRNNSAQKAASNKENQKVIVGREPVTTVHSGGLLLQHTFASFNGGVDSDNMSNSSSSLSEMSDNIFRHHNGDNNSSDLMPASLLEGKKSQVIKEST